MASLAEGFTEALPNVDVDVAVSTALGLKSIVFLKSKSPCTLDL